MTDVCLRVRCNIVEDLAEVLISGKNPQTLKELYGDLTDRRLVTVIYCSPEEVLEIRTNELLWKSIVKAAECLAAVEKGELC